MSKLIVLDSTPLALLSQPSRKPAAEACRNWLDTVAGSGVPILIPEIIDYEVRRELVRVNATAGIRRLDALLERFNLLPLSRPALRRAAELWAQLRNAGLPTDRPEALDIDAILAAQALTAAQPGDIIIVATSNVRHLARFPKIDARPWELVI